MKIKKIKNNLDFFLYGFYQKNFSPFFIIFINSLIFKTNIPKPPNTFNDLMMTYFSIWSVEQWVSSLISLVLIYLAAGKLFNRYLSHRINWTNLSTTALLLLIGFDLVLNFAVGIYYMSYRDTALGALMLSCPIAISPFIFAIELSLIFIIYVLKQRAK